MDAEKTTHTVFILALGSLYSTFLCLALIVLPESTNKHLLSLAISLASILGSYRINHKLIKSGICLGGVLQFLITLGYHWKLYDELLKIGIYGSTLLLLVYYTYYFPVPTSYAFDNIMTIALSSIYSIFTFTFVGYLSDKSLEQEAYKRGLLLMTSISTISVGFTFIEKSKTTRYGIILGGVLVFVITLFLDWDHFSDYEKAVILGIPLMTILWYGIHIKPNNYYTTQSSKPIQEFDNLLYLVSIFLGSMYLIFVGTIFKIMHLDYETTQLMFLVTSLITMYSATYMSPSLSKYSLLIGGLTMLLIVSLSNFQLYSHMNILIITGIALATLLYFTSRIEANSK